MRNSKLNPACMLILTTCMLFISCSDANDYTTGMPEARLINEISIDNLKSNTLYLAVGMDSIMEWSVTPADLMDQRVKWSSSDESVATVSPSGKISAVSVGEAVISITPEIGFGSIGAMKSVPIKIVPAIIKTIGITFSNTENSIYETDRLSLVPVISPTEHTYDYLTWKSSDPSVATVSDKGVVTGVKAGNVTITAYTHDKSGVYASYELSVITYISASKVEIQPYNDLLCINDPVMLHVTYTPVDATLGSVEWTTSDENIVRVDKGLLTPVGFGVVDITAKCKENGQTTSVSVTVDAGWYKWDAEDGFSGWATATNGASAVIANGKMSVTMFKNPNNWRGDIKYTGSPISFGGNRPILAIKGTMPSAGNRKWDAVAITSAGNVNSGGSNQTGTKTAKDGTPVYYYDMTTKIPALATALCPFSLFQFKMADFPLSSSSGTYDIYWIRTFKNESDLNAYIAAE